MNNGRFPLRVSELLAPASDGIAASLSASLKRKTDVQMGEIRPVDVEELKADFPQEAVMARAPFSEGVSGDFAYIISAAGAGSWINAVLDEKAGEEADVKEHLDKVGDVLNQISSAWCQALSRVAGFTVERDPVQVSPGTVEERAAELESYFRIDFTLSTQDLKDVLLTLLFSPDAVNDIKTLGQEVAAAQDDRPPPAVLDDAGVGEGGPEVRSARFEDFGSQRIGGDGSPQNIEILMDLELPVIIELGRTSMFIKDILELGPGSIIELNKLSGEPVDLYVNDRKFAQGEVVVIDENFGIRITDLVKVEDRIRSLK